MTHNPGDRVFAKIKGFSNWPARINPLPPDVQVPKGKLPVFFYGTYQVSFVPVKNIVPYEKFKDKWGKPKPNPQFMAAMDEIETNPGIFMLGEDSRAESFLRQFYNFDAGSCSRSIQLSSHARAQDAYLESVSEAALSSCPSGNGKNVVPHSWRNHTKSNRKNAVESLSETSSELSSSVSRHDDSDETHDVSEQFDMNKTLVSDSLATVTAQDPSISHGNEELSVAVTRLDSTRIVESDLHEASRLARKLQKKALKKAMKKAAKREAKRMAKEAERAERRARREAKRELKRIHRLEKQRLLEEQHLRLTMGNVGHSSPVHPWLVHPHLDSVSVSPSRQASPASESPYDALIAAEFGGGDLSSMMDRSTSPLKLDTYEQSDLPLDVLPRKHAPATEIEEAMFQNAWSSTSPISLPFSPSISPVVDLKRALEHSPDVPKIDYYKDATSGVESELEVTFPEKRTKAEVPHSPDVPVKLVLTDDACLDHGRGTAPELLTKQESSSSKTRNKHSRGGSRNRTKSRKRITTHRRRLVDSSEDSDSSMERTTFPERETHLRLQDLTTATVLSGENVVDKEASDTSPLTNLKSDHRTNTTQLELADKTIKSTKNSTSEVQEKSIVPINDASEVSKKPQSPEDLSRPDSPGSADVVTQLCHLCRELKASLVRGHENFSLAVQHLTRLSTIPVRLPQLAQAWDLMDCIKKCRRYKLSAEVREAAQRTLRTFQAIQSTATKEELALTQSLLAAHLSRSHTVQADQTNKSGALSNNQSLAQIDLTAPVTAAVKSTPSASTVQTIPAIGTATDITLTSLQLSPTDSEAKSSSLNADLAAKVDDMLSLIRATDQRMAASASFHPKSSSKPQLTAGMSMESHPGNSISGRVTELGHNIRASAVAAAAAHMHDEEDEESVMSRVEQVAAYEAASKVSSSASRSPPPPPPPPLITSAALITTTKTSSHTVKPLEMSVDLDLDSRIEMLMTGPKSGTSQAKSVKCLPSSSSSKLPDLDRKQSLPPLTIGTTNTGKLVNIPPALLAQRQTIVEKIAANRASSLSSPVKSLPQPKMSTQPQISSFSTPSSTKDEELYDLLGV